MNSDLTSLTHQSILPYDVITGVTSLWAGLSDHLELVAQWGGGGGGGGIGALRTSLEICLFVCGGGGGEY